MMRRHRYRGHRARSFVSTDVDQLVELRARQRTYNGAYGRTVLGNLGYSLTVLRLFNRRFYRIGIMYAVLAFLLCICAFLRARHSRHDFADQDDADQTSGSLAIPTVGQEHEHPFGRPFVTPGRIVALVACVVAVTEVTLLVLVLQL
ncbi:hypothetical protein B0F90DRAFT_1682083 [Multifurca ochricompacta]|uniref:DUF202 domain-containing protein n=1 Tax=Multifurca ochricompacta TaxID=376703 RepID=A0AAD4QSD9_9AGAM|nr:hypothetical protein B0F90DRAFT_1682083 [Multifurca ochricompacta]